MTFRSLHQPGDLYFITASVCGKSPIFLDQEYASIVLNSLAWLREQNRIKLFAYVLMPTHLHAIILPIRYQIGEILQMLGSFTAHEILREMERQGRTDWLDIFHRHKRDRRHRFSIWQDIQAKNIFSSRFLQQKLEYIHCNPTAGEHPLARERSEYLYSSARYYDLGLPPIIPVDNLAEFLST